MSSLNPLTISVALNQNSYPIWIQRNIHKFIPELLNPLNNGQEWFILSPNSVFELYGKNLIKLISEHGYKVTQIIIEEGENVKSFKYFEEYSRKLVQLGCNRDSYLIALGGGVTGDLCGYIASSLFRGINYIQIPTTLLAMVDSSIGGKTGINIQEGKNLIGAFHHPKAVIIDPNFIKSLPSREINSGLGEIIKYGFIQTPSIIDKYKNLKTLENLLNSKILDDLIYLSANTKAKIVSQDSNETDLRRILNFGHTVGHVIEAFTKFSMFSHGEAVIYGMIVALKLSQDFCGLNYQIVDDSINILKNIPSKKLPEIPEKEFLQYLLRDKKVIDKKVNFILLKKFGKPEIRDDITPNEIYKYYKEIWRNLK